MSADVISHQAPRRKHTHAWSGRRIAVLVVAAAAIIVASWLALDENRPPPALSASAPQTAQPLPAPAVSATPIIEAGTPAVAPQPVRRSRRRSDLPVNAAVQAEPAGYEILSAAELDSISQARE